MSKIVVSGASGKMGQAILARLVKEEDWTLIGALVAPHDDKIGQDCGQAFGMRFGVPFSTDLHLVDKADLIIDFSRPDFTMALLPLIIEYGKKIVIGTTGFDEWQKEAIQLAAEETAICFAPNMSVGVNLLYALVRLASKISQDDVEIIEMHHKHKVDAPSGTALRLAEEINQARNEPLDLVYGRHGSRKRSHNEIGIHAIRAGEIVGDHTVLFAGEGERLELTHRAWDRGAFAKGALLAARFLLQKERGLYDMQDVLGL
jgi:4-hydroxy-tetrahydrodipicolinate reductase